MLGIARAVAFIWLRPYRGKMWELATSVDNVRVGLVEARHVAPARPGTSAATADEKVRVTCSYATTPRLSHVRGVNWSRV
jgi:hypothetical protein